MAFALVAFAAAVCALSTGAALRWRRRALVDLERARSAAESRSAELEIFAGRVAHDILSPLSSVSLAVSAVLPRVRDDELAENALRRAGRGVEAVRELVASLLEHARAGATPAPGVTCDASEVVCDVVGEARREAEHAGITLAVDVAVGAHVPCSAGVMTSIVSNLVGNATKHMGKRPRRLVTVRTQIEPEAVHLEVEDTGPGVPEALRERIFEPFVRVASDGRGVGLGLATVRRLVEAHGGRVGVRSRVGEGSVFWVELPGAYRAA